MLSLDFSLEELEVFYLSLKVRDRVVSVQHFFCEFLLVVGVAPIPFSLLPRVSDFARRKLLAGVPQ